MTVRHRILHLSDTHLDSPDVDASAALAGIRHDARVVPDVALVVVSGDIGATMAGASGRCAAVSDVAGLRVVTLDSLVPGEDVMAEEP